ncbi:MAG: prepilin-type N-terminal cleavage/methylation domain-containing protein [Magnetococcales bacterium]|nr:prepilin-type N-terminal cleavage/methylation domain-containing protein [Magnetococcales bacterium]
MKRSNAGFSLIEVLIAMTIMGLLLGSGVMMGRSLINNAHAKEIVAMATDLNIAIKNFKERFHYFPGDLPNAANDITAVGQASPCHYSGGTHGDGQIGAIAGNNIDTTEVDCVSNHLYHAGVIKWGAASISSRYGSVRVIATAASNFSTITLPGNPMHIIEFANLPRDIAMDVDRIMDNSDVSSGRLQGVGKNNADNTIFSLSGLTLDQLPDPIAFYAIPL